MADVALRSLEVTMGHHRLDIEKVSAIMGLAASIFVILQIIVS